MIRGTLSEAKEEIDILLERWEEEGVTNRIIQLKREILSLEGTDKELSSICVFLLNYCITEHQFWSENQREVFIDPAKFEERLSRIVGFDFIQYIITYITEATRTWGKPTSYLDFLLTILIELHYLISEKVTNIGTSPVIYSPEIIYLNNSIKLFNGLTKRVLDHIEQFDSLQSKIDNLREIENVVWNYIGDVQNKLNIQSKNKDEYFAAGKQFQSKRDEDNRILEKYQIGRKIIELRKIRFKRMQPFKFLTQLLIPNQLIMLTYSERIQRSFIRFVIEESLSRINTYSRYASTIRYQHKMGPRILSELIQALDPSPGMKFLELFANVPILSWSLAFLGLEVTAIDNSFSADIGIITSFMNQANSFLENNQYDQFYNFLLEFEEKEKMGAPITGEISAAYVDTLGILMQNRWLYTEIQSRFKPYSLDLSNLDVSLKEIRHSYFDRIFIDPPYNWRTDYLDTNHILLLSNALQIARKVGNSDFICYLSVPRFNREGDRGFKLRKEFFNILEKNGWEFEKPGRRRRFMRIY